MACSMKERVIHKVVDWKSGLTTGADWQRRFVPLLEFAEVWLTHGPKEVATRVWRRLGTRTLLPPAGYLPPVASSSVLPRLAIPPLAASADVSIVIPVLDETAVTYNCLASIVAHAKAGSYEAIVIDNGSKAETRAMLASVAGLTCIWNDQNAGFVDACNQGARLASGRFILFLNNDAALLPGSLEAMLSTFNARPNAGAVGAKLIYPDGRLQEAGGVIWLDGTGLNYGKGSNPDAPEFSYVREVDYCSAACLLVEASLWKSLDGFDARYAPAYYEDTDLCFRIREMGSAVYYQPAARVVHLEGTTAGRDESAGFKRYQGRNRQRFSERHARALQTQCPPDSRMLYRARDRRSGKRLLVVDDMVPHHDRNSGSVRAAAILKILTELGHAVTFLPDNLTETQPYTSALQQLGIEVLYGPMSGLGWVRDHVDQFDVVILCSALFAQKYLTAVNAARRRPLVIFDTVDLHYLREERQAALENSDTLRRRAARTREAELAVARASDCVWVTSTHEAALLAGIPDFPRVDIVPNIHASAASVPGFEGRQGLLFIGGFRHPPNEDAIIYFVSEVLPLIVEKLPGVQLHIVGSDVPAAVQALACPSVVIDGFVRDVVPLFDSCRLSVAPLRYGAGMKGKVSQSLALGLPVVTTPVGAEGMQLRHREHVLIGATPREFAKHVVELYEDKRLWDHLSQNGRELAAQTMSYAIVREKIRDVLANVSPTR
jgi:GT2 family glycosyltransferase